jgi:hypothetical protein
LDIWGVIKSIMLWLRMIVIMSEREQRIDLENLMFTTTDGDPEHNHKVEPDGNGTGETLDTSEGPKHTHEVKDYKVAPGGEDQHTHELETELDKSYMEETSKKQPRVEAVERKPMKDAIKEFQAKKVKGKSIAAGPGVNITINIGESNDGPDGSDD